MVGLEAGGIIMYLSLPELLQSHLQIESQQMRRLAGLATGLVYRVECGYWATWDVLLVMAMT